MNLRDQILNAKDIITEEVHVPEWDTTVFIKTMSGEEKTLLEINSMIDSPNGQVNEKGEVLKEADIENFRARLLVYTMCSDKEGKERIFTEEDVPSLSKKSVKALDRCLAVAQKLNAITKKDEEAIVKNSEKIQGEVSG